MKNGSLLFLLLGALIVVPTSSQASDSSFLGTGIGAALGGYLGSTIGKGDGQLAATAGGVFLGGLIGNSIGSSMDRADAAYYSGGYGPSYYTPTYQTYYQPNYVAPSPQTSQVIFVEPQYAQPQYIQTYAPYTSRRQTVYVEEGYVGAPPRRGHHYERRHCREFTQTVYVDGRPRESYGTACLRPDGSWQMER